MENKYFTPNIEDFHIGYEYEQALIDCSWFITGWEKRIIDEQSNLKLIKEYSFFQRVPYLTKEQIEAEGWTSFITEYENDIVTEKMIYTFFKEDRNYMLGCNFNTNKITLIIKDPSLVLDYYTEPTFRGECKDINTFRKIIKLLKI